MEMENVLNANNVFIYKIKIVKKFLIHVMNIIQLVIVKLAISDIF